MKILLLGKDGQVGWELQRSLASLGKVIAFGRKPDAGECIDLTRLDVLSATVRAVGPDLIVNAAGYTAVDRAETEAMIARVVNADAVAVLAEEARHLGALLVHYSTDYVFDGRGSIPWHEDSEASPLSAYGQTKLAGEQAIVRSGCAHLIFRTSWVYAARGRNFIHTMLRLARERSHISVVADQIGAPTGAELIADVTAHALRVYRARPEVSGLYHLAAAGEASWHDYASFVFDYARAQGQVLTLRELMSIPSEAYPTSAKRPLNSRLDTTRLCRTFDLVMPDWRSGVARVLDEILES